MQLASPESLIRNWLSTQFPSAKVVTETPAKLVENLPVILVNRISGADRIFLTIDDAVIDVDYYAATRDAARSGAEAVRDKLRFTLPGLIVENATILAVDTNVAPQWTPYPNTNLRRFSATYNIRVHTQAQAS